MVKKERYESTIGAVFRRNWHFMALAAIIFFGSMFLGYLHIFDSFLAPIQQEFKKRVVQGEIQLTTFSLLENNFRVLIYVYGGGITLGLVTVIFLFINGSVFGYFATKAPLADFIILTVPHGIFEISSFIIAGAAGFRLANFLFDFIREMIDLEWYGSFMGKIKHVYNDYSDQITESLILFGIAAVLLIIAAIIEANFTLWFYQYIQTSI